MVKDKFTPSEKRPLVKYTDGEPPSGMFIYGIIVGVILYISGHCPDKYFAVNFCTQYIFIPKISHEFE